jgi:chromosome segregation ATPase
MSKTTRLRIWILTIFLALFYTSCVYKIANATESVSAYFIEELKSNSVGKSLRSVPLFGSLLKENSIVGRVIIAKRNKGAYEISFSGKKIRTRQKGNTVQFTWHTNEISADFQQRTVSAENRENKSRVDYALRLIFDTSKYDSLIKTSSDLLKQEKKNNEKLQTQLKLKTSELGELVNEFEMSKNELRTSNRNIQEKMEETLKLNDEILSQTAESKLLKSRIVELEKSIVEEKTEAKLLVKQRNMLEEQLLSSQGNINELAASLSVNRKQLESSRAELQEIKAQDLVNKIALADQEISHLNTMLQQKNIQLNSLTEQLKKDRTEELSEKVKDLEVEIESYKNQVKLGSLSDDDRNKILKSENIKLKQANLELTENLIALKAKQLSLTEGFQQKAQNFETQKEEFLNEIQACETNLVDLKTKSKKLNAELDLSNGRLTQINEEYESLRSKMPKSKGGTALCLEW